MFLFVSTCYSQTSEEKLYRNFLQPDTTLNNRFIERDLIKITKKNKGDDMNQRSKLQCCTEIESAIFAEIGLFPCELMMKFILNQKRFLFRDYLRYPGAKFDFWFHETVNISCTNKTCCHFLSS